jgi:hypothetical protein
MINHKLLLYGVILLLNLYNIEIFINDLITAQANFSFNIFDGNSEVHLDEVIVQRGSFGEEELPSPPIVPLSKYKKLSRGSLSRVKMQLNEEIHSFKYKFKQNVKSIKNNRSQFINIKIDEAKASDSKLSF